MNKIINKILEAIIGYRLVIISLVLLLIFGFILLKIQKISNYKSNAAYLEQQQEKTQVRQINIDQRLVEQLQSLEETTIDVRPDNLGTQDPFQP